MVKLQCCKVSPSVHKKGKQESRREENQSKKLTHAHLHFKAFKAAEEDWSELSLILLFSRLSKFMEKEEEEEEEK